MARIITCIDCGVEVENAGARRLRCDPCGREHHQARVRRYQHARRDAGMPPGGYAAVLAAQGGGCAICGATEAGGRWGTFNVDRGPAGEVRGLLCAVCAVLPRLADATRLAAALTYLLRRPAPAVSG